MTTFHLHSLLKEKRIQMIGEFYDIVDSLQNRSEVRLFFKSLLHADEIARLMRRIEIAVLLSVNFGYGDIIELLGVGKNTISHVQKSLLQDDSGYTIIVKRLIENRKARLKKMKKEKRNAASSFGAIKKKYSGHFLLNNLLDAAIEKMSDDKELEKEAVLYTPSSTFLRSRKK